MRFRKSRQTHFKHKKATFDLDLVSAEGSAVTFDKVVCGTDAEGKTIYNIPHECVLADGESYSVSINDKVLKELRAGPCGHLFP